MKNDRRIPYATIKLIQLKTTKPDTSQEITFAHEIPDENLYKNVKKITHSKEEFINVLKKEWIDLKGIVFEKQEYFEECKPFLEKLRDMEITF